MNMRHETEFPRVEANAVTNGTNGTRFGEKNNICRLSFFSIGLLFFLEKEVDKVVR